MRRCTQCHIEKPLTEFYPDASKRSGYRSACKKCWTRQNYQAKKQRDWKRLSGEPDLGPTPDRSYRALDNHIRAFLDLGEQERTVATQLVGAAEPNKRGIVLRKVPHGSRIVMRTPRGEYSRALCDETVRGLAEFLWAHKLEVLWGEERSERSGEGELGGEDRHGE